MTTKDKVRSTEEALKLELQRIRSIVGQVTGLDDEDEDNLRDAYKSIDRVIDSLSESQSDVEQPAQDDPCVDGSCSCCWSHLDGGPAQQEPVAYIRKDQLQKAAQSPMLCEVTPEPRQDRISIYTFPPNVPTARASKPWVGLTDEERNAIGRHHAYVDNIIRATEAKLKEKNDF